jgi:hypothetical protein
MVTRFALVALTALACAPALARAQDIKSPDLVKQLTMLLEQKKIDAIAAPDAQNPGGYVAALYFPGTQLLVVSAKYSAPALLTELLARKDYRAVYAELTSASVPGSKLFVNDVYANGLALKPSGSNPPDSIESAANPPDSIESAATQATFDGAWKKAKIAEADYIKSFTDADAAYTRVLQELINLLKSSGTASS